jgi:ABC-type transport system involved in cytochrome c biogenesis permease component
MSRLQTILQTGFDESALSTQVLLNVGLALLLFVVCWTIFDRFTEYVPRTASPRGIMPRIKGRRFVRVFRPWACALVWKDFHFVAGGPVIAAIKLVAYPLLVLAIYHQSNMLTLLSRMSVAESAWMAVLLMGVIELLVCATRIFRQERQNGTLPTLMLLPRSTSRIAYAKVAGCLLGSLPTILVFIALALTLPLPEWIRNFLVDEQYAVCLAVFIVLLHLTALNSLVVRWGALPLAVAALIILGGCGVPVLFSAVQAVAFTSQDDVAKLGPIFYTAGIVATVLQVVIGFRLRAVAAQ